MTENEAIKKLSYDNTAYGGACTEEVRKTAIKVLEEVQQYRETGAAEELQKTQKEEKILKFYYCETEDSYLLGKRVGNYYYAHYRDGSWVFDMSRYLPWGKHIKDDTTAWKEHTYPSEPTEIDFSEWLDGFIKKECGGTPEECRAAVEKQIEEKPTAVLGIFGGTEYECKNCGSDVCQGDEYCRWCGQKLDWSDVE